MFIAKKAQALTELAVFGTILLMLLGILLHYGLKYNYQQQVTQEAFRRTLGIIAEGIRADNAVPGSAALSANYMIMKEKQIPSPENPFGMGSLVPVSSNASVMRDHKMMDAPSNKSDLPRIYTDIAGQYFSAGGETRNYFYTAAIRDEDNVLDWQLTFDYDCDEDGTIDEGVSRYACIYGAKGTGWWIRSKGPCVCDMWASRDPVGLVEPECPPTCETQNIRIVDDCEGEVVNLETIKKRCHQIERAGIRAPWYCDAANQESLFSRSSDKKNPALGLQENYTQKTKASNVLRKEESNTSIKTTETLDWRFITNRQIIYNDHINDDGTVPAEGNVNPTPIELESVVCHNGKCEAGTRNPQKNTYTTTW